MAWSATISAMSAEAVCAIVGAVVAVLTLLLSGLAFAVAWGRGKQALEGLLEAVKELNRQVQDGAQQNAVQDVRLEQHAEAVERLESRVFAAKRH